MHTTNQNSIPYVSLLRSIHDDRVTLDKEEVNSAQVLHKQEVHLHQSTLYREMYVPYTMFLRTPPAPNPENSKKEMSATEEQARNFTVKGVPMAIR
jgi:hypothetical protein